VTAKSDQDPDPQLAPWIRIRIEIKSWIQICTETNADPQYCILLKLILTVGGSAEIINNSVWVCVLCNGSLVELPEHIKKFTQLYGQKLE
jgi:hypothetical protein